MAEPGPEPGPPRSLSRALHCAFLPLGHAVQVGRRDTGSLGVLSARWRLPPAPRPPAAQRRSWSPGHRVRVGLAVCCPFIPSAPPRPFSLLPRAAVPFGGQTELSFHRDQRQARRPPLCPAVDVAPGHQGDARASGGLALPVHAVSPARRLRCPSVRPSVQTTDLSALTTPRASTLPPRGDLFLGPSPAPWPASACVLASTTP